MATKTVNLDLCDICHANGQEAEAKNAITFRGKTRLLCKVHGDRMAAELEKICTLPKSAYEAA